jgi:hypothetical protein
MGEPNVAGKKFRDSVGARGEATLDNISKLKKVKFNLEQATKVQKGSRSIALPFP